MKFLSIVIFVVALFCVQSFAQTSFLNNDSLNNDFFKTDSLTNSAFVSVDTIVDTVFIYRTDGIPWNRENFDRNLLLRREPVSPALSVAYTYSVSFMGGTFGSFAHQSYIAHLAYEFSPELHLYANLGLWMPLYAHFNGPQIAREDVRQGRVQFVLPDVELEYKPTSNTTIRLMFVNESDAFKAYGPFRHYHRRCFAYDYDCW